MKTRCPRCERKYLLAATIKPLLFEIVICPECEAFWPVNTPITRGNARNYYAFMAQHGLPADWKILKIGEEI